MSVGRRLDVHVDGHAWRHGYAGQLTHSFARVRRRIRIALMTTATASAFLLEGCTASTNVQTYIDGWASSDSVATLRVAGLEDSEAARGASGVAPRGFEPLTQGLGTPRGVEDHAHVPGATCACEPHGERARSAAGESGCRCAPKGSGACGSQPVPLSANRDLGDHGLKRRKPVHGKSSDRLGD